MENKTQKTNGNPEMECYAVHVGAGLRLGDNIEETRKFFTQVNSVLKAIDHVCICAGPRGEGLLVCFPACSDGKKNADSAIEELVGKGIDAKLNRKKIKIDTRYLDGIYKSFVATIPPYEIEREIIRIMDAYCVGWKATENPLLDMVFYEGELGGGRMISIITQFGDGALSTGISGGNMRYTRDVKREWKNMLNDFEDEIRAWRREHPGIVALEKRRNEA